MKVNQEEVVDRQTVLSIELEDDDLDPYLERGYRRVVQRTNVPGFRKGKAPRRIIENFVGKEGLLNEVMDTLLTEVTSKAIDSQELEAFGLPRIELIDFTPLTFKATVPLKPEIDLGAYRDIRIDEELAEVTEEDVEARLEEMRQSMATWNPVERPVKFDDMIAAETIATSEGETVLNDPDSVFFLQEGSDRPFPGFAEKLQGAEIDELREFSLDIPEDFYFSAIAGQNVQFSIKVKEVKEQTLPELDDELAKSVGGDEETLDALRERVESELKEETETRANNDYTRSVVDAIMEGATVELPPLIVEHEINHMEQQRQMTLDRIGMRLDDYLQSVGKTGEEVRGQMEEEAKQRLSRSLVLSRLAEVEGVDVSDEETEERLQSIFAEDAPEQQPTQEHRDSVRQMLRGDKTLDRLASIAKGEAPALVEPASEPTAEEANDEQTPEEGEHPNDSQA